MLKLGQANVMWAWVCPATDSVLSEAWGATEAYATGKAERHWGKHGMAAGYMRAVRVTIDVLTVEETEAERARYARWKAEAHALHAVATAVPNVMLTGVLQRVRCS